jgi:hypothetical protein
MSELREAISPPDDENARLLTVARAAFAWRTVDEELELVSLSYDSSMAESSDFRGEVGASARMLVFETDRLTIELEVTGDVLMGQLVPAAFKTVRLESASGHVMESQPDDAGFFLLRRPPAGPIRLKLEGQPGLVTQWLPI